MYSRSFLNESGGSVELPESYNGNAFSLPSDNAKDVGIPINGEATAEAAEQTGAEPRLTLGRIPILSSLLPNGLGLSMPNIGTEEILIICAAAFLFFSKNGDKEAAIMLIILLFIA